MSRCSYFLLQTPRNHQKARAPGSARRRGWSAGGVGRNAEAEERAVGLRGGRAGPSLGGGGEGVVLDDDAVVGLVALAQGAQDLDRLLPRRRTDFDRLEAARDDRV